MRGGTPMSAATAPQRLSTGLAPRSRLRTRWRQSARRASTRRMQADDKGFRTWTFQGLQSEPGRPRSILTRCCFGIASFGPMGL
jgi:hypothetical protein